MTFDDVPDGAWYKGAVDYASSRGIMTGYAGSDLFGPEDVLKREDVASMLFKWLAPEEHRYWEGKREGDVVAIPVASNETPCGDVEDGRAYTAAVNWAFKNGIMNGYGAGSELFGVGDPISREQFAVVLKNANDKLLDGKGASACLAALADESSVSPWAQEAVSWARQSFIITGNEGYLYPQRAITRAEASKMAMVFDQVYNTASGSLA